MSNDPNTIGPGDPLYPGEKDPLIEKLEDDDTEAALQPGSDDEQPTWPSDPEAPEQDPAVSTSYPE